MKATVLSQLHGQLFLRKKEKKRSCVAHRQPQVTLPELTKIAFPPPRMSGCLLLGYRLADEFIIYDVLCVFFGKTTVLIIQFICRIFHTCWWSQDGFQTVTPQKKNCSQVTDMNWIVREFTCFSQPSVCWAVVVTSSEQETCAPAPTVLFTGAGPSHRDPLLWRHGQVTGPTAVC